MTKGENIMKKSIRNLLHNTLHQSKKLLVLSFILGSSLLIASEAHGQTRQGTQTEQTRTTDAGHEQWNKFSKKVEMTMRKYGGKMTPQQWKTLYNENEMQTYNMGENATAYNRMVSFNMEVAGIFMREGYINYVHWQEFMGEMNDIYTREATIAVKNQYDFSNELNDINAREDTIANAKKGALQEETDSINAREARIKSAHEKEAADEMQAIADREAQIARQRQRETSVSTTTQTRTKKVAKTTTKPATKAINTSKQSNVLILPTK